MTMCLIINTTDDIIRDITGEVFFISVGNSVRIH